MRVVKCPRCGAAVDWEAGAHRPFCSERCRLVDLGAWLGEKYVIPGSMTDESASAQDADDTPGPDEHDDES